MIREISFFSEATEPVGLEPSGPIRDLGPIVLIVGANGAGKSRYLRLVAEMMAAAPNAAQERDTLIEDLRNLEAANGAARAVPGEPESSVGRAREAETKRRRLAFVSRLLDPAAILVDDPAGRRLPTERDVCIDLTIRPLSHGEQRKDPIHVAYQSTPAVVEKAARSLFNAENTRLAAMPAFAEATREALRLNTLLRSLMDKQIEPEVDPVDGAVHAKLGDRRFDVTELSSGERVLVTWAVFLLRQAESLQNAVVLIDEPEVHLHPTVTQRLLSRLFSEELLGARGQVWMATHSPTVILAAGTDRVLLAEKGTLRWSKPTSSEVLGGLDERPPPPLRLSPPPLPIGNSDFQKLRRGGAGYVDKTPLIAEVLRSPAEVLLFTRPRRFGKTMNLSMLRSFLELTDEDRSDLFRGLVIETDREVFKHFQRYPVIDLTFKDVKSLTWSECLRSVGLKLASTFQEHEAVLRSGMLSKHEGRRFEVILEDRANDLQLREAIRFLSEVLSRHHRSPVVILIDEYDTPIHSAYLNAYYDEAVDFFRGLFSVALKDNRHLFKGVLSGVLRVAKESLFSGLNNVASYSLLRPDYSAYFGFTEDEVGKLLRESGSLDRGGELKAWYDGYRFGDRTIYNPWSVANYLSRQDPEPQPYWTDTSDHALLKQLLLRDGVGLRGDLQVLLSGGPIHTTITEDIVLRDIEQRPDAVWSLLLFSGYLKPSSAGAGAPGAKMALTIPNREVMHAFEQLVRENMIERLGSEAGLGSLTRALLSGDTLTVQEYLERFLLDSTSYHSPGARTPEVFYNGLLTGLAGHLKPDFGVQSEPNAGRGRADILITPRRQGEPGVVIEIKTLAKRETFEHAIAAALAQLRDRQYAAALRDAGAGEIHEFAAVFDRQHVRVKKR